VSGAIHVKLSNLTVDGTGNSVENCGLNVIGILYQNASGTVNEVVARNQTLPGFTGCQTGVGIYVQSGAGGKSTVTVSNSSVHDYQKGGITGRGIGTTLIATGNSVRGLGPDPLIAQNGIEIGIGATGTIGNNAVANDIYQNAVSPGDGASGILVFASSKVQVVSNTIGNTQFGITVASDPVLGAADSATIRNNNIFGTILFDGIDLCSNKNVVIGNNIFDSAESGVHLDDTCGTTGNQNTVSGNTINEACAGLLRGSATSGNVVVLNTAFNVVNQILSGDTCSSSDAPAVAVTTAAVATDGLESPSRQY
jgi:parallel beta-helix repeat protein